MHCNWVPFGKRQTANVIILVICLANPKRACDRISICSCCFQFSHSVRRLAFPKGKMILVYRQFLSSLLAVAVMPQPKLYWLVIMLATHPCIQLHIHQFCVYYSIDTRFLGLFWFSSAVAAATAYFFFGSFVSLHFLPLFRTIIFSSLCFGFCSLTLASISTSVP